MHLATVVDVIPGNTRIAIFIQLGFNETDTPKFSLILIYDDTNDSIYTQRKCSMLRLII